MISGSIVALVTPMHEDGSIHWEDLEALVDWHIASGTAAIVPVGTTGESPTVSMQENCEIVSRVVQTVNGRIPVIAGTGANATSEAIELTAAACESGADACLLVTPYYNKPTQEGLFRHYEAIAAAVDIPQVLYNVPGRTACDLLPETVKRLSEIEQIVAIKEATGNISRLKEILELCGSDIVVYSGDDATACDLMLNGAMGTISVTANVVPVQMAAVCKAALDGKVDEANRLNKPLSALHDNLFLESNPIPVKWALEEMGKIKKGIRLPLTELSNNFHDRLRQAMHQAGIFK